MPNYYKLVNFGGKRGRGLQAIVNIPNNTVVARTPIVIVPNDDVGNTLGHYVFKWDDNNVALALGAASLFNHSNTPNCEFGPDHSNKTIKVTSIRPITKGQELTVHYGWDDQFLEGLDKPDDGGSRRKTMIKANFIKTHQFKVTASYKPSEHDELFKENYLEPYGTKRLEGRTVHYYRKKSGTNPNLDGDLHTDLQSMGYERKPDYYGDGVRDKESMVLLHGNNKVDIRHNDGDIHHVLHTVFDRPRKEKSTAGTNNMAKVTVPAVIARMQREIGAGRRPQLQAFRTTEDHKTTYNLFRRYINGDDLAMFPQFQYDLDKLIGEYRGEGLEGLPATSTPNVDSNIGPAMRNEIPASISNPPELVPAAASELACTIGDLLAR